VVSTAQPSLSPSLLRTLSPTAASNSSCTAVINQTSLACNAQLNAQVDVLLANTTNPGYAYDCLAVKQLFAQYWGCFYASGNACTSFPICLEACALDGLAPLNGNVSLLVKIVSHGDSGICTYSSCNAFCAGPTVPPSSSPAPPTSAPLSPNSTCQATAVEQACAAHAALPANNSDYDTACRNAKTYEANLKYCMYATTLYGNCSQAFCLEACNATNLADANDAIATLARSASGGGNGTCLYSTCQEACMPAAPSSASPVVAVPLLGVAAAMVTWLFLY